MNHVMPRAAVLRQALGKTNIEEQRPITMLTIPQVCRSLAVSKHSVYRLINEGKLKSIRIGRRRLVSSTSIARFVAQLEAEIPEAGQEY